MVIIGVTIETILARNVNARRIFGKKEIDIVIKQLEGVSLTQSERNRLSRDIRPKLEFIREIAAFQDEFAVERNQKNKRIMAKAINVILHDKLNENIMAILLFGSFATGLYDKHSDIDIAVLFRNAIESSEATAFRIRVSGELPEKADIQVFNVLPQKVKKSIALNHRVLYSAPDFDNPNFSIRYAKEDDYSIRMKTIFEKNETAN